MAFFDLYGVGFPGKLDYLPYVLVYMAPGYLVWSGWKGVPSKRIEVAALRSGP